jgi:hypothetical protein
MKRRCRFRGCVDGRGWWHMPDGQAMKQRGRRANSATLNWRPVFQKEQRRTGAIYSPTGTPLVTRTSEISPGRTLVDAAGEKVHAHNPYRRARRFTLGLSFCSHCVSVLLCFLLMENSTWRWVQ